MSDDNDLNRVAEAYWMQLAERGAARQSNIPRRRARKPEIPEDSDSTDPTILIVRTLLDNVDVTQELVAESQTARQAMAETERRMAQRADTASTEMRTLTLAVQNLTTSQAALERLRSDRYIWVFGGMMIGAVLGCLAMTTLPEIWQKFFG
jgi:hypothetical protein